MSKKLIGYDLDDILHLANLQRRQSVAGLVAPTLGLLVLGAAVGAAVGLMFAPSSGRRFREEVGDRIDQMRERVKTMNNSQAERAPNNGTSLV